ncbi:MAG: DMT family transporter [Cyanobacteria bacterium]|nr:DMT family transporter [Cyanobacteriota bacterium]MDW8200036.1 DMT family transporter [Cyanobacteriota bacterium SKYGB_h_bin112]
MGIALILCSAICLALQNVIIKLLFSQESVLGLVTLGGWVLPSLSHSLLLMHMRTLLMTGLLLTIAPWIHPTTFHELRSLQQPQYQPLFWRMVGTGTLLFLSLTFLYIAISNATTGIAVTLFFIHPAVTVLLAWLAWGDRPTALRFAIVGLVLGGVFLATPYSEQINQATLWIGTGAAIAAGLSFGAYNILAQSCLQPQAGKATCHPIPFTVVNFLVTVLLASLCLPLLQIRIMADQWLPAWVATFLCAIATLTAYVLNFYGIRWLGAVTTALVSASNPVMTCLLAWLVIGETLQGTQGIGVMLVALGVAALSVTTHTP